VRADADLAQLGSEVARAECLVCAQGGRLRSVGMRRDQVQRGQPLGVARGADDDGSDDQAVPVLRQCMAHEAERHLLARPHSEQPGVRVCGRCMRVVAAFLAAEVLLAIEARIGRLA
jgi:hypothetical protein